MTEGYLSLLLHAHLPFVRHPEHTRFLEETWLFEAITETYIPMLGVVERLVEDSVPVKLTVSISPTLTEMLQDELLQQRYVAHLDRLRRLAAAEVNRTAGEPAFNRLAEMYGARLREVAERFERRYQRNLVGALGDLQRQGVIEIMTCAATHAFLPLLKTEPSSVRAQIAVGVESYRRAFGQAPEGIWLPECGYYPGLEVELARAGLRYFVVDAHGVMHADVQPHYGLRAPISCPNGIAAFPRDPESSVQVWSARGGYPGDAAYRDFYRDIGFDLDFAYVQPYVLDEETRGFTGFKYYRVTGPNRDKAPYDPDAARARATEHAKDFLRRRCEEVRRHAQHMDRPPLILAPYDAELFGHWWFEGPCFLEEVFRQAGSEATGLTCLSPREYLARHPVLQRATPSASSWGVEGYNDHWLNKVTDWAYPEIHAASREMTELVGKFGGAGEASSTGRALRQAARVLLLAQASDWTFMMRAGTSAEYARRRIRDYLARFRYLAQAVREQKIEERRLSALELMDKLFGFIDFHVFADAGKPEGGGEST